MRHDNKRETPTIGIIADDLTGAADTGVQLTAKGLEVSVLFQLDREEPHSDGIVIDTDSRTQSPTTAYQRVSHGVRWLRERGTQMIYKKIDSTLRGNVGVEIQAAMEELDFDFAVIAPAYPKMGRTTVNGIHYIHGVPLHETEISRDPKTPVTESNLCRLLEDQTGKQAALLHPRQWGEDWDATLMECKKKGIQWLVFDAETDEDLAEIVRHMKAYSVLWVGSAGLAEHLLDILPDRKGRELPPTKGPVLTISGSMSGVTRKQVNRLLQEPGTTGVELDPSLLLEPNSEISKQWIYRMNRVLEQGQDLVVFVSTKEGAMDRVLQKAKVAGWSRAEAGDRIARSLGRLSGEIIQRNHVERLVLTGGDTAKSVCNQLGVHGLTLRGEVEPGLPISTLPGDPVRMVITKAGAFGSEESLVYATQRLKGMRAHV